MPRTSYGSCACSGFIPNLSAYMVSPEKLPPASTSPSIYVYTCAFVIYVSYVLGWLNLIL